MANARHLPLLLAGVGAVALSGCASHVKGSWACALQPGVVCGSISDIDNASTKTAARDRSAPDPVIEGAIPAKLWGEGGWVAGSGGGAPIRDQDEIVKVAIAPWIDEQGDYHAGADVFAVMRRGGWYAAPRSMVRRVELSAAAGLPPADRTSTPPATPGVAPALSAVSTPPPTLAPASAVRTAMTSGQSAAPAAAK